MKTVAPGVGWLVGAILALSGQPASSDQDAFENCPDVFADPSFGAPWYRNQCRQALGEYRAQLEAWGIRTDGMTDIQAWNRHGAEQKVRNEARQEQEQRAAVERERLAAERAAHEAEQAKVAAQADRDARAYSERQMRAGQEMLQQQNEMLKGLGVNLGGVAIADDEESDDEYSATELAMYQRMVDEGAAPGCRGLTGAALVDCVDEALDEEE